MTPSDIPTIEGSIKDISIPSFSALMARDKGEA